MDLDREIERRAGMPITRIFSEHGEETFREMERDLTLELRVGDSMVLAPGGGWITRSETVALLRPPGCIIYMRASPETAFRRMGTEWALRPLLAAGGNGLERLNELYRTRRATYEAADAVVDTELLSPQQVAEKIAAIVVSLERAG
jgi:shikimate kinase